MSNTTTAKITDIIYFHGATLQVITHDGVKYVPAKPLSDLAGNHWRTTKKTIIEGDNATLYATKQIQFNEFASQGGASATLSNVLCMRLDRIYIYLACISTNQMKAQGNVEAANTLLQLQVEWADVLHNYETRGFASKGKMDTTLVSLNQLIKTRSLLKDPNEYQAYTALIHQKMQEAGLPIQKQQLSLLDQE